MVERLRVGIGCGGQHTHTYRATRGPIFRREHAFVKVHDFASAWALPSPQREKELEVMLGSVIHERELLELCASERLDRVVKILAADSYVPTGGTISESVNFIVLELADGDVRDAVAGAWGRDAKARFEGLRDIARGLWQMNSRGYAYQDLKPENALIYATEGAIKLGDVETASRQGSSRALPHEEEDYAGDRAYAPIEQLYGFRHTDWKVRRFGADAYLLGSMVFSLFCGLGASQITLRRLEPEYGPGRSTNYEEILPFIQLAFAAALEDLRTEVGKVAGAEAAERCTRLVSALCDPDPNRRGHPTARKNRHGNPFDMARCVEDFQVLARLAAGTETARRRRKVK